MNLDNYYILEYFGIEKIPLKGEYNSKKLFEEMGNEWVPYIECGRKCSRSDYCKFVKVNPHHKERTLEIHCGVIEGALNNFIKYTFPLLKDKRTSQIQNYLNGAYHFCKYVSLSEFHIGDYFNDYFLESMGNYAPSVFGQINLIREHLNQMANYLKDFSQIGIQKGILLVEGKSEETLLNKLKESKNISFLYTKIENYEGEGNISFGKIEILIKDYKKRGYQIYIQGDADVKNAEKINTLISKNLVKKENTFVFKNDLESSIPIKLLYSALQNLGLLNNIMISDFQEVAKERGNKSIIKVIKENYNIDIGPYKNELALNVGDIINRTHDCWRDEHFMKSELGQFLLFTMKIL